VTRTRLIKTILFGFAALGAAGLAWGPVFVTPEGADPADPSAQRALAVFVVCVALWFTSLIPLAATGLLAIALLPLLDVMPSKAAFALFGNKAVFFMLGVFLLTSAMIVTGLSKRLTLVFLQRFDKTPSQLVTGILLTSACLAMIMPEHAVAAMIFPILVEITESLKLKKGRSEYAKMLFLALAWGSIIGGVGTFLGGARAPLALGMLAEFNGATISFMDWMVAALPIVIVMTLCARFVLHKTFTCDIDTIQAATKMLDARVRRLGPMSWRERRLAILGVTTILVWIFLGQRLGLAVVAVISGTMIFALRIATWQQVQDYVNWGVLIMYGGAVALGVALHETLAIEWIVDTTLGEYIKSVPHVVVLGGLAVVAIVLTEGISNSAAVAIMLPIGYSLSETLGIDPITVTLIVTISAGLAFSFPVSSPPNAISFSAGYYSVTHVVRRGVFLNLAAMIVVVLTMAVYWPLLGIGK
jgi:solute carrier family 13 (sodium-dependent dicarboxylate transporter), member 2/3/5